MTSVAPTWMVLARDVSESVVVSGQRRTVVAAVLDAATGMVLNVTPGTSSEDVLRRALKGALVRPAAPLPNAVPELLVCPAELVEAVRSAATALTELAAAEITEGAGMNDAEEIVDSIVGHMEGREQPVDLPSAGDWRILLSTRWCSSAWLPIKVLGATAYSSLMRRSSSISIRGARPMASTRTRLDAMDGV